MRNNMRPEEFSAIERARARNAKRLIDQAATGCGVGYGLFMCGECNQVHLGIWIAGELVINLRLPPDEAISLQFDLGALIGDALQFSKPAGTA